MAATAFPESNQASELFMSHLPTGFDHALDVPLTSLTSA
jgi:hypothetical protein